MNGTTMSIVIYSELSSLEGPKDESDTSFDSLLKLQGQAY